MSISAKWSRRGFMSGISSLTAMMFGSRKLLATPSPGAAKDGTVTGFGHSGNVYEELGVTTVINGQGISQSPVVRAHAAIPDDEIIVTCVAMGWPDETFAANDVKSSRVPVDRIAHFVGFED